MALENPFPLNIGSKEDSWDKQQLLANVPHNFKQNAPEFNKIIKALEYLYANTGEAFVNGAPVQNSYTDIPSMLADQANQTTGFLQYVIDATGDPDINFGDPNIDAFYNKLEATTGALSDYTRVNKTSSQVATNGYLEAIIDINGVGYVLRGRNEANYGPVGARAIDLSFNFIGSLTKGATGLNSVAFGVVVEASGVYATVSGYGGIASGYASYANCLFNFARSMAEFSTGRFGTDYTSTDDGTDRLLNIGNGENSASRSDAFSVFRNGAAKFFAATLASITNAARGFFIVNTDDANRPYIHNGTEWKGLAYKGEAPLEEQILGTIKETGQILGATTNLDWATETSIVGSLANNTTFVDVNFPPEGTTQVKDILLKGLNTAFFPSYWVKNPRSSTYDELHWNLITAKILINNATEKLVYYTVEDTFITPQ